MIEKESFTGDDVCELWVFKPAAAHCGRSHGNQKQECYAIMMPLAVPLAHAKQQLQHLSL